MIEFQTALYCDGSGTTEEDDAGGGWGVAVYIQGKLTYQFGGRATKTTNNRMELRAAIESCRLLAEHPLPRPAIIYSDSQYVVLGLTQWLPGWRKRGWRTADKKPVKNREYWEELESAWVLAQNPAFKHVRGHSGIEGNEVADKIAGWYRLNEGDHPSLALPEGRYEQLSII